MPDIKFTASDIVMRPIDELKPFPNNPKIHTAEQVSALSANILAFGFDQPILIDEGDTILKGHGRQLGARKAKLTMVPTIVRSGLSADDKWAIVISDNALPAMTGFDQSLLRIGLTQLAKVDYPLNLTGFDDVRLAAFGIGDGAPQSDPDEEQEPAAIEISKLGDIWLMGAHRIACGSSTDKKTVDALLDGDEPRLMVTDPPYGVEYDPNWRNSADRSTHIKGLKIGATAVGVVQNDDRSDWSEAWALFAGDVAYVWHAGLHASVVFESLKKGGFEVRSQIMWNKQTHIIGRGDYHWKHEPCWYAVRKGKAGNFNRSGAEGRKQNTVWDIAHRSSETGHSTQKPIECMKRPIENNSKVGDQIYEPFAGSGTTIIAAEMTGRACLAVELSPAYVDVCIRRWQEFTGKKATLQSSGKTFDQIAKTRSKAAA